MRPGRELDALIAEKLVGLEVTECRNFYTVRRALILIPKYSTEIYCAWPLLEYVVREGVVTVIFPHEAEVCCVETFKGVSVPHAICLAALKLKGIEL